MWLRLSRFAEELPKVGERAEGIRAVSHTARVRPCYPPSTAEHDSGTGAGGKEIVCARRCWPTLSIATGCRAIWRRSKSIVRI